MKIVTFEEKYINEMAKLFVNVYSEPGYEWDIATATKYLQLNYNNFPKYSLIALSESKKCIGGIFCKVNSYYKGKFLFIDTVQVKKEHRKQGVAKLLIKSVLQMAEKDEMTGVHFLADKRKKFPMNWYKKLGFEETNWIELEAKIRDLKGHLLE